MDSIVPINIRKTCTEINQSTNHAINVGRCCIAAKPALSKLPRLPDAVKYQVLRRYIVNTSAKITGIKPTKPFIRISCELEKRKNYCSDLLNQKPITVSEKISASNIATNIAIKNAGISVKKDKNIKLNI
jgi:hypothetical protein